MAVVHLLEWLWIVIVLESEIGVVFDPDLSCQDLDEAVPFAVVVDWRAVVGRPDLKHGHAARSQPLVAKHLEPDISNSFFIDIVHHIFLFLESLPISREEFVRCLSILLCLDSIND